MSDRSPELPDCARLEHYPTNASALAEIMEQAATQDGLSRLPVATREGETAELHCFVLRPAIQGTKTTKAQPMYVAFKDAEKIFVATVQKGQAHYKMTTVADPDGEHAYWIADAIDTSERSLRTLDSNFRFYKVWVEHAQAKPEATVEAFLSSTPELKSIHTALFATGLAQQTGDKVVKSVQRYAHVRDAVRRAVNLGIWPLLLRTYPEGLGWIQELQDRADAARAQNLSASSRPQGSPA